MKGNEVTRRLTAWAKGRPLPRGATVHVRVGEPADALILAFVKMGGESSPWGIAFGHPGDDARILTVPEPRNRDLVADMAAAVAPVLLEHFRHPEFDEETPDDWRELGEVRQVWVPNASHLDMLHFLNYTYTFTKWGSQDRVHLLNALGRLSGWLFREAQRPGQLTVMAGTEALRRCYTFPAEDVRQAHLGFLLAWLETEGGREARMIAAREAEQLSIATSLDPAVERDSLSDMVEAWNDAQSDAKDREMGRHAARIEEVLTAELTRRYELVKRAMDALQSDERRVNRGLDDLENASNQEFWYQYLRTERNLDAEEDGPAFVPSPETDRYPAAAGARYFVHEASEELQLGALIHDDEELQEEAIADGEALRGEITAVRDEDPGRAMVPVWTLDIPDTNILRVREGSWLCVAGLPNRTVIVRSIDSAGDGNLIVEVEVTNLKRKPRKGSEGVLQADDATLVGETVTLVPSSSEGMLRRKSRKIWERGTPGSWLTHSKPAGTNADLPAEAAEDVDTLHRKQVGE